MESQPVFFTRTFDEALQIIVEARDYMCDMETLQNHCLNTLPIAHYVYEANRVIVRLAEVMAWLMMQRAVQGGEISMEEALSEHNRLSRSKVCQDNATNDDPSLPAGLRSLLERSGRLYQRVERLEQMVLSRGSRNHNRPTLSKGCR